MGIQLKNNASGTLATAISASDTGIVLTTGNGASFPALGATDYFYATLESTGGTFEVVKVTARSGDSMTVVRAQEGSTANSFAAGSRIELRVTAQSVLDAIGSVEASQIGVTPYGWIAATDVQDAFEEVVDDLGASSGSSLVGFQQAGGSSVLRTTQAKLRETVSVQDFGADPTGVADATSAIQNAQNASSQIYFSVGTYRIASNLTITAGAVIADGVIFSVGSGVTLSFGPGTVDSIKPEWFYTSGGYQTALSKAFKVQRDSVNAALGMAAYGRIIPVVLQPNKAYVISGSITGQDYLTLIGNSASIQTAAAFPFNYTFAIIINIGYQPTIDNVTFLGGYNVLVFPQNTQDYEISIANCKFTDFKGTVILGSSSLQAQHLICKDCEFTTRYVDSSICDIAWDKAVMKDCQYIGPSTTKFINRNNLVLEDWKTSPIPPQGGEVWPTAPRWIYNEGITLEVSRFRFGGEPGAHRILQNESGVSIQFAATSISITNCAISTGGDYGMVLNNMPANFVFRDNYGMTAAAPILYGGASTSGEAGTQNIGRTNIDFDAGIYAQSRSMYGSLSSSNSSATMPRIAAAMNRYKQLGTRTLTTGSKIVDKTYGLMSGAVQPLFTVTTTTDIFGATVQKIVGANGDNTFNSFSNFGTTDLTGLPAGTYTLVVNITVGANGGVAYAGNPVSFGIVGSLIENFWNLTPGNHTLSMEFYWDGTNNPELGYSVYNVDNATYFAHDGFRLFTGSADVQTWNTVSYADAAPAAGYHRLGDRVVRLTPVIGQPKGWVCTVAGTPGTWTSEGNL